MRNKLTALALPALLLSTAVHAAPPQGSGVAWDITADLTSEVGQRLAATPREAAARDWAVERLRKLGFANVRIEPFTMPGWERGEERAALTVPAPQRLAVTALGNSGSTGPKGLEAEVVYFETIDALRAAPDGSLRGKIAFVDHAMAPTQDGSSYGPFGAARRQGPMLAGQKGAVAIVIRSIGTDSHRNPHTGVATQPEGVNLIPSAAVSNPDGDLIARFARAGKPMRMNLLLTPKFTGPQQSGNVIAELPGRDPSLPPLLLACHLDSWDLGTGAIDDAAGCGIITAAALQASREGQLLRTVRLLWAGAEEVGVYGGAAYGRAHAGQPHALAMESDFGADRVWQLRLKLAPANKDLGDRIAAALAPMGIARSSIEADGGADTGAIAAAQKLALIDLMQDGTRYFDLHHTPDDTLDKVDPAQLQQNVDAWAAVLRVVGNEAGPIAPVG